MNYYLVSFYQTDTNSRWDDRENDWVDIGHSHRRILLVKSGTFSEACDMIKQKLEVKDGDINTERVKVEGFQNMTLE